MKKSLFLVRRNTLIIIRECLVLFKAMKRVYPPEVLSKIVISTEAGNTCYLNADTFEVVEIPYAIMDHDYKPTIEPYISLLEKIKNEWNISIRVDPTDYIDYQYAMQDFVKHGISDIFLTESLDGYMFEKDFIMNLKSYIEQADYNIEWYKFKHQYLVDSLKSYLDFDPETTPPQQEINGFFNDDGTPVDLDSIPIPGLCISCKSYFTDDWEENLLCKMNRHDQKDDDEFNCGAFNKL